MPKINAAGQPSYAGATGVVENAAGEKHELDPSRNLDGSRVDGYTNEDETAAEPEHADGTEQSAQPVDEPVEDESSDESSSKTSGKVTPIKRAPAKK